MCFAFDFHQNIGKFSPDAWLNDLQREMNFPLLFFLASFHMHTLDRLQLELRVHVCVLIWNEATLRTVNEEKKNQWTTFKKAKAYERD